MNKLLEVFKSWRFWSIFLVALGRAIEQLSTGEDFLKTLIAFITTVAGGATVVRTIDRFSDKV